MDHNWELMSDHGIKNWFVKYKPLFFPDVSFCTWQVCKNCNMAKYCDKFHTTPAYHISYNYDVECRKILW